MGLPAKISIVEPKKRKIDPKTIDAIFIGYALDSNVNWFLVVNSEIREISNNTIIEARHVYFENIFPFKSRIPSVLTLFRSLISLLLVLLLLLLILNLKSKRTMTLTSFSEYFFTYLVKSDPSSFKEAMDSSESPFWKLSGKKPLIVRSSS